MTIKKLARTFCIVASLSLLGCAADSAGIETTASSVGNCERIGSTSNGLGFSYSTYSCPLYDGNYYSILHVAEADLSTGNFDLRVSSEPAARIASAPEYQGRELAQTVRDEDDLRLASIDGGGPVLAAINASFFGFNRQHKGIAASHGSFWSHQDCDATFYGEWSLAWDGNATVPDVQRLEDYSCHSQADATGPRFTDAISGYGYLVRDGVACVRGGSNCRYPGGSPDSFYEGQHARTVLASGGDKVWFVVAGALQLKTGADRKSIGMPMTGDELQGFLVALGIRDAVMLDGNGSSEMIIPGEAAYDPNRFSEGIVNYPTDGRERSVETAVMLMLR